MPYGVLLGVAIAIILILAGITMFRWWQTTGERQRQRRLGAAFDRAQRVRQAGTGEQGKPYSLYGEESWKH
jgi:type II secretory pathway pseudopilin PulG